MKTKRKIFTRTGAAFSSSSKASGRSPVVGKFTTRIFASFTIRRKRNQSPAFSATINTATRSFAAVHAGWRGTSASIVRRAIEQMESEYGAQATNMRAAIGPAANVCCYEVGSEVINVFKERFPQANQLFKPTRDGHARIDLHLANRDQLIDAGVSADRIHVAPLCTMDRTGLFFSYRRERQLHGRVGRLMSVIGRSDEL